MSALRGIVATSAGEPASLVTVEDSDLGDGEVLIEPEWSSLNYKDALALTGSAPVVRRFPLICGIDVAGTVIESSDSTFAVGETVLVTGCGLGESRPGGYASRLRVPASICVQLPMMLSAKDAMVYGTAGVTAMLSLIALEHARERREVLSDLPVLVTGATGGVGALAVAMCARAGLSVVASTGKADEAPFLTSLGASEVIDRAQLATPIGALSHPRFADAIDVVGGATLAHVLAEIAHGGAVAACGLVGGSDLSTTIYPFILRAVSLIGINSVTLESSVRAEVWSRLSTALDPSELEALTITESIDNVFSVAQSVLSGATRGRVVLDCSPLRS